MTQVLVTGGTGFIGSWCVTALLDAGHTVRTTVRDLRREPALRSWLHAAAPFDDDRLEVVRADLEHPDGWDAAAADRDFVLHVASPTLRHTLANDDELVVPAREGVLRVLRAARAARVRRVVLTSAFGAIGIGHPRARPRSPRRTGPTSTATSRPTSAPRHSPNAPPGSSSKTKAVDWNWQRFIPWVSLDHYSAPTTHPPCALCAECSRDRFLRALLSGWASSTCATSRICTCAR